ncbi:hypothetical protein BU15DRAFT_66402 [Melanogaster broomeanus]|nr:hypothetical protein BU15DRAFT_66402 [Melanogaster broomeanus]
MYKTYETDNYYLIAMASSSTEDDAMITIWKKHIPSGNELSGENGRLTIWLFLKTIIQVLIHVLAVAMVVLLVSQVTVSWQPARVEELSNIPKNPHVDLINLRKDVWRHYREFKSFEVEEVFQLLEQMQQMAANGESGTVTAEDISVQQAGTVETDEKLMVEISQRNHWGSLSGVNIPDRL